MIVEMLVGFGDGGAVARVARREVEALLAHGDRVSVISDFQGTDPLERAFPDRFRAIGIWPRALRRARYRLPGEPLYAWRAYRALRRLADREAIRLIVFHKSTLARGTLALAAAARVPAVHVAHGLACQQTAAGAYMDDRLTLRWYRRANRYALSHASRCIAVSQHIADLAIREGAPADRVAVRHNPVDTDTFCPGPAGAATLNDVLFVGRLSPEKGLDVLLGAAARLRSGVRIAVVGKGPLRRRLERQARSTAAQWHFVDWIDHARIPDVIRSSKLVVVPSLLEGHPLVVLEAMACGIPVIAARAGGIPEVVEHGVNGWLTAAGDADALAHAIDRALADDVARCRAGQAARRTALSFSIGEFQRRTLDLYGAPEPALGAGCR